MITLDSITRESKFDPPRIVIYGVGGIGKSTFGAATESPIFAPTEKGIGKLAVPHFPQVQSYQDGLDILGALAQEEHQFKTLVWDSLDWWEPHIWQKVCQEAGKSNIEDFGYGKGYIYADTQWKQYLNCLTWLQENKGMAIILTAHAEVKRFDSPETEPYDRYQIKLHKRAAELVSEWADIIFFANWEVYTVKTDVGFKKQVARGQGSGRRILYTEERPAWKAKNRYGLPPKIELTMPFDWNGFINFISGNQPLITESTDTKQEV